MSGLSFAVVAALLAASPATPAARANAPAVERTQAERIDGVVRTEMRRRRIPGLQVAVVRSGRIVFGRAYGVADLESGARVTPATVFTLNSSTKAFTGVAIMQLVQDGKLALDAPVSRYLDDLPPAWRAVTLRQLLTHISGLPDILIPPRGQGTGTLVGSGGEDAAWATVKTMPIEAPPGTRYRYNQTNYVLLGKVIERVAGEPFVRFMAARQFAPAGMMHAAFGDARTIMPGRARTYRYTETGVGIGSPDAPLEHAFDDFVPIIRTAGGLNATATDVARWLIALQNGRLMNAPTRAAMWTPARFNDGSSTQWGMGWPLRPDAVHPVVTAIGGRRSAYFVYPKDDLAVVVLTNLAGANPEEFIGEIAGQFVPDLLLDNGGGLSPALDRLRRALVKDGFDHADAVHAALQRQDPGLRLPEGELNEWGGRLMQADQTDRAIAIFGLATRLYPASANAQDSLGEGYERAGSPALAAQAYRRSLALDPANDHAIARLKVLTGDRPVR